MLLSLTLECLAEVMKAWAVRRTWPQTSEHAHSGRDLSLNTLWAPSLEAWWP